MQKLISEPLIKVSLDEVVVGEFGVHSVHSVDLLVLTGRHSLLGIKAPDALEETLSAKNLMKTYINISLNFINIINRKEKLLGK